MRRIREAVLPLAASDEHLSQTVREYRQKYKGVSQILDAHGEILEAVHEELEKLSHGGRKGRGGDFTSATILWALIVHAIEGLSFRETVVRIAASDFLQDFLRTRKKAVREHSFLNRCFQAVRPATWKRVNELLGQQAVKEEVLAPATIRADTTVVETNTHWPTDSSLLWDTWRVASRWLKRGREIALESCPHRFHDRKTKRLHLFITRYAKSPSKKRQRKVKSAFRKLIARHEKLFGQRPEVLAADKGFCPDAAKYAELEQRVGLLALPRRMQDFADKVLAMWQSFRLKKRAFRLARCFYRGFKRFKGPLGWPCSRITSSSWRRAHDLTHPITPN